MSTEKLSFIITVTNPCGISKTEWKDYIRDAINCWRGRLHPDDVLFYTKLKVTVRPHKELNIVPENRRDR